MHANIDRAFYISRRFFPICPFSDRSKSGANNNIKCKEAFDFISPPPVTLYGNNQRIKLIF